MVTTREAVLTALDSHPARLECDARALPELSVLVGVQGGMSPAGCTPDQIGRLLAQNGVGPLWRYVLMRGWGPTALAAILTEYRLVAADLDVVTLTRR
ncbi:hypothetical protein [Lacticaseibacillus kribbianus]|uniref:hypothetical protein n=1 Tax=Lacticaseibacillus kribbianus TaxID=2926292 RepID=UPI001CD1D607|nr:hypothetical protein [Lacticaseibacillus kribbianus]